MKKILLTLGVIFSVWMLAHAQSITVPGSSFPQTNSPQNWFRLLMVDTNGQASGNSLTRSNVTIRWDNMVSLLTSIINPSFPWLIVTNGSATATIQSQLNSLTNGGVVAFQPGDYTITATLNVTNKMVIFGDGATLHYQAGLTGFMLDTGTNYSKALIVDSLNFDGGTYTNFNSTNFFVLVNRAPLFDDANPYFNSHWANRSGMRAETSGGVNIQNCYSYGWTGNGFVFLSTKAAVQPFYPKLMFTQNHVYTNFLGVMLACTSEDIQGYYNNNTSGYGAWSCEYAILAQNDFNNNYIGSSVSPGNVNVQGNQYTENFLPFFMASENGNSGHGSYTFNTLNHNAYALWVAHIQQGGFWANNVMLRNGQDAAPGATNVVYPYGSSSGIHFDDVKRVTFVENDLDRQYITFTNDCRGTFQRNHFGSLQATEWDTNLIWGVTVPTNINSTLIVSDNQDTYGVTSDGSAVSVLRKSANLLFNVGTWPPTYASTEATSTNQGWQALSNSVPPHWWFGHFDASSNVVFDGHF